MPFPNMVDAFKMFGTYVAFLVAFAMIVLGGSGPSGPSRPYIAGLPLGVPVEVACFDPPKDEPAEGVQLELPFAERPVTSMARGLAPDGAPASRFLISGVQNVYA